MEEVGTSLPDVQSREIQILEEGSNVNMQQKFNTSTCNVYNKDAKMQQIRIYLAMNVTCKYITDARSYRRINFTILFKRKANTHVLVARQQAW